MRDSTEGHFKSHYNTINGKVVPLKTKTSKTPAVNSTKIRPVDFTTHKQSTHGHSNSYNAGAGFAIVNQAQAHSQQRGGQRQSSRERDLADKMDGGSQNSQNQPFIILQRSPNVVNHFSLAPASGQDSQLSSNNIQIGKSGKRNHNKTTIDALPSLTNNEKSRFSEARIHQRRVTVGGNSDQKDQVGGQL